MELLINKEQDLIFSWDPGCFFNGEYIKGEVGRRGPGVTDEDLKKPWAKPGIPNTLVFNISIKDENNCVLYDEILEMLNTMKQFDRIEISNRGPVLVKEKIGVKKGAQSKIDDIEVKNKETGHKISLLINQLEELGCNCDDLIGPNYHSVSDDLYEWNEYIDNSRANISISCHNKTQFYKFLQEKGILDKYFPEWY